MHVAGEAHGVGLVVDRERRRVAERGRRRGAGCARTPSGTSTPTSSRRPARRASPTRCFISSAALLVKVMARISNGPTPWSWIRWAMRWVSTRVLPDPAPATTSSGPSAWATASCWTGLRPSRRESPGSSMGRPGYWHGRTALAGRRPLRSGRGRSEGRRRGAPRQPQPPHARRLRRPRVRHPEPGPVGRSIGALHQPPRGFAAVHARPPRPARGRARLPVAALGIDRGVGGRHHAPAPA